MSNNVDKGNRKERYLAVVVGNVPLMSCAVQNISGLLSACSYGKYRSSASPGAYHCHGSDMSSLEGFPDDVVNNLQELVDDWKHGEGCRGVVWVEAALGRDGIVADVESELCRESWKYKNHIGVSTFECEVPAEV